MEVYLDMLKYIWDNCLYSSAAVYGLMFAAAVYDLKHSPLQVLSCLAGAWILIGLQIYQRS